MSEKKKYRNITFTLFNYTDIDMNNINKLHDIYANYILYGRETCPTSGRLHLQGYIQLSKQLRLSEIKNKICNNTIHIENANGSWMQNYTYCTKDGDYIEIGSPKKPGKRTDIDMIRDMINKNKPMSEIIKITNNYQCIRFAEKLLQYKTLDTKPIGLEVYYVTGPSGSGKTTYCYNNINKESFWRNKPGSLNWFNGYDSQSDVIINEFRDSFCNFNTLLELLDGYEVSVEIKGGFTIWRPKRIFINSIKKPWELYTDLNDEDKYQLYRRITKVITLANFEVASEVVGNTIPQLLNDNVIID